MKVIDSIRKATRPLFTFELLPPRKGGTIDKLFNTVSDLMEFAPSYINVTYHQHEVEYIERPDGLMEKRVVQKRPGTISISTALSNKFKVPVVPHLICGGFTREETEDALIDLNFLGFENILALRGDPVSGQKRFTPEPGGHAHANELVEQIVNMNQGKFLNPGLKNTAHSDFCIGVAGYPEKHYESPNMKTDIHWLKHKVAAGADYIVTQMFFHNDKYFRFLDMCREAGIEVPVIPGLKPISTFKDIDMIPRAFHIDIPYELCSEVAKCENKHQVRQVGVEWTTQQALELKKFGVPALHFFTLGQSDNIKKIASRVF
jgi:methylenetetrahydrofolate reductase (NADPH)